MKNEDRNNRRKHVKNNKNEEITGKSKKSNEINRYFAELCNRVPEFDTYGIWSALRPLRIVVLLRGIRVPT